MPENIKSRRGIAVTDNEIETSAKFSDENRNSLFYSSETTAVVYHPYPSADMHSHDFYEVEFILSGNGVCRFNGKEKEISRGAVMLLAPSSIHDFHITDGKPVILSMRLLSTYDVILNDLFPASVGFCEILPEEIIFWIEKEIESALKMNLTIGEAYRESFMRSTIQRVLIRVASFIAPTKNFLENSREIKFIEVLVFIRQRFRGEISLSEVAARFGYSPNHLSKRLREITGKSFSEYVTDLRMNYAFAFVAHTDRSFKQISLDSGYKSYPCFLKAFLKKFGETPSETRMRIIV